MPPQWTEGIDYEILPDQKVRCLHCSKVLESKAGLGPHLSKCVKPAQTGPSSEGEVMPDLYDNMVQVLKSFGIKHSEALAGYMKDVGYDDLHALKRVLTLEMIGPQKTQLVLERWSQIIGKPLDPSLIAELQTNSRQYYMPPPNPQTQPSLTKEEVLAIMEEREKQKELEKLRNEVQELRTMLTEGNPRKPNEFEELKRLLLERERNEVLTRLNKLEGYIMSGITSPYAFLALSVKEFADIIKNSPLRHYILTGSPYPPQQKEIESGARESIFQKLSERYVLESD